MKFIDMILEEGQALGLDRVTRPWLMQKLLRNEMRCEACWRRMSVSVLTTRYPQLCRPAPNQERIICHRCRITKRYLKMKQEPEMPTPEEECASRIQCN